MHARMHARTLPRVKARDVLGTTGRTDGRAGWSGGERKREREWVLRAPLRGSGCAHMCACCVFGGLADSANPPLALAFSRHLPSRPLLFPLPWYVLPFSPSPWHTSPLVLGPSPTVAAAAAAAAGVVVVLLLLLLLRRLTGVA